MKQILSCIFLFILLGNCSSVISAESFYSNNFASTQYVNNDFRLRTIQDNGTIRNLNVGVQTPYVVIPNYKKTRYTGFEGSKFNHRSYYIPPYCTPGSAFYNGTHNPFCSQYHPYGSGFYTNF